MTKRWHPEKSPPEEGSSESKITPREEDIQAAIRFRAAQGHDVKQMRLRLVGIRMMDPKKFASDFGCFGPSERPGWLRKHHESRWPEKLHVRYLRTFDHIINLRRQGVMPPGIQIDGKLGDGLARAMFHFAIGEKMPVAIFETVSRENRQDAKTVERDGKMYPVVEETQDDVCVLVDRSRLWWSKSLVRIVKRSGIRWTPRGWL